MRDESRPPVLEVIAALRHAAQEIAENMAYQENKYWSDLEATVASSGLASVVRFLGFRRDIGDILNASDVVVAPTLREGLSISVLEAMAMGRPIVTTSS